MTDTDVPNGAGSRLVIFMRGFNYPKMGYYAGKRKKGDHLYASGKK